MATVNKSAVTEYSLTMTEEEAVGLLTLLYWGVAAGTVESLNLSTLVASVVGNVPHPDYPTYFDSLAKVGGE